MNEETARRIAEKFLVEAYQGPVCVGEAREMERSWVFNLRASEIIFGLAPIVVDKQTGEAGFRRSAGLEFIPKLSRWKRFVRWLNRHSDY